TRYPLSLLLSSGRTRGGDGPVDGADGRAGGREGGGIYQAVDGEAPSGTSEPARTARDGRDFHSGEDAGCRRRTDLPGKASEQRVAVGRHELIRPGGSPGKGKGRGPGVHLVRDGQRELTKIGSVSGGVHRRRQDRGAPRDGRNRGDGNNPYEAAFERHLLSCGHGAG